MIAFILLFIIYLIYNTQKTADCNQTGGIPVCGNSNSCPGSQTKCATTTSVVLKKVCGNESSLVGLQPDGPNQVLTTNDTGSIEWENQCSFNGMNNLTTSAKNAGFIINTGSSTNCLATLSPTQSNQIPIVDANGNLTWINVSDLLGMIAFAITTLDGLAANGVPGGVLNSSGTLGFDSWQIDPTSKALEPKTSLVGSLGDPTHILSSTNQVALKLYNGANAQTIVLVLSVHTHGELHHQIQFQLLLFKQILQEIYLIYLTGGSSSQVLVTGPGNVPVWIEQCMFDGMNINALSVAFNGSGMTISGVVANNGNASNCLVTINPGTSAINSANKVFVTDSSGNMHLD